jgi:hypothetical protein
VASYYPSLIINAGIAPPAYGHHFASVYHSLLKRRLAAKVAGNKVINEALKIVLNGTFGKLGSMYSMMYAPDQMIAVTSRSSAPTRTAWCHWCRATCKIRLRRL